jgi:hypothetical protein
MCSFTHYSCVTGIARADFTQLPDAGCQWRLAQLTSIFDQGPFENRCPPKSHAENAGSPNLRSGRADLGTTVANPNTVAKINVTVSMISRSVRLYKCRPIWLSILSCSPSPEQVSRLDGHFSSSSFVLFPLWSIALPTWPQNFSLYIFLP